ncbi:hypothetical protein PspLS_09413 [Pyricularia sp. CBS 133598]|nr:hypothetical protein PspLS_09413 [Pyricularia sp. CBS 133598]
MVNEAAIESQEVRVHRLADDKHGCHRHLGFPFLSLRPLQLGPWNLSGLTVAASSENRGAVTKVTPSPTTPAGFAYLFADI